MKNNPHLILFFTRGVSLQTWQQKGMFERELALYNCYLDMGWKISFVTYGDKRDLLFKPSLKGINILCNRWNLPPDKYQRYLYLLHGYSIFIADILKTNQLKGAEIALKVSKFWNKPLVVRCGYLWSSVSQERSQRGLLTNIDIINEGDVFRNSDHNIVTTEIMKKYVQNKYSISDEKISVIPNYVQVDVFKPLHIKAKPAQICCVAKFTDQKNHINLIKACEGLGVTLVLIGDGPLENDFRNLAERLNVNIKILGSIPNQRIPEILQESEIAILVSLIEGHPKTLIEAMSCGLPVIGSNVSGIKEIIQHGKNGFICNTDVDSIRAAIQTVMNDKNLQFNLGENARIFVKENFSLEKVISQEVSIMNDILLKKYSFDQSLQFL